MFKELTLNQIFIKKPVTKIFFFNKLTNGYKQVNSLLVTRVFLKSKYAQYRKIYYRFNKLTKYWKYCSVRYFLRNINLDFKVYTHDLDISLNMRTYTLILGFIRGKC